MNSDQDNTPGPSSKSNNRGVDSWLTHNGHLKTPSSPASPHDVLLSNNSKLARYMTATQTINASDSKLHSSTCTSPLGNKTETRYLPNFLKVLLEGRNSGLPVQITVDVPNWFDLDKYKIGQEFAKKYYFGVTFAEMLSLFMLFTFEDSFKALIFTDRSGTVITSFRRYLSTVLRVKSWYEENVFDSNTMAYDNIRIVRAMHSSVSKKMNELPPDCVDARIKRAIESKRITCDSIKAIEKDFTASYCRSSSDTSDYINPDRGSPIFFNQFSMTITQFGFVGLLVLHPEKFGAASATDEELEGFIHLWRVLGHLLGIEDKYNFCNGTLNEVKTRSQDMIDYWVVPNFTYLSPEWEHFSRCLVKGVGIYIKLITFESSFLYFCDTLEIEAKKFLEKSSWSTYFTYLIMKFTLSFAVRIPFIQNLFNKLLYISLSRAKHYSELLYAIT